MTRPRTLPLSGGINSKEADVTMSKAMKGSVISMLAFLAIAWLAAGCTPTTTGAVKEDVTLTEETQRLEELGAAYSGPAYAVAILTFENKTPSRVLGVGEAATDILRTIVKKSGLEPVTLTRAEMTEQERLIELQQTGALKVGKKDAAAGFESVDYRISGAITSYSEVEESSEIILAQSKTRIARVQVDYALVDVESGQTLLAESGMGEYRKKTGGLLGLGSRSSADPGLRDGALRDALTKAMTRMIEKLNAVPFRSRVLLVDGTTLVIRAGFKSNLDTGTVLGVYRTGAELVDPDTGRVIGTREKLIGEVVLTSHQNENISDTQVRSGTGFKAGDVVRVKQ